MTQLLFATTNQGKFEEAKLLLSKLNLRLLSVNDFGQLHDLVVEEMGATFKRNALIKAQVYGEAAQVLTLAEDSGLIVDALNGKPGVKSARFGINDNQRNLKLLRLMNGKENRTARFVSVFCLFDPQTKQTQYFRGKVEGQIASKMKGELGFGYDPLFIPRGYKETFAELGGEVKNKISHRRQAVIKLRFWLEKKMIYNIFYKLPMSHRPRLKVGKDVEI